jgi:hypothetical protein
MRTAGQSDLYPIRQRLGHFWFGSAVSRDDRRPAFRDQPMAPTNHQQVRVVSTGLLQGVLCTFGRAVCRHRHKILRRNAAGIMGTRLLSMWRLVAPKGPELSAREQAETECRSSHPASGNGIGAASRKIGPKFTLPLTSAVGVAFQFTMPQNGNSIIIRLIPAEHHANSAGGPARRNCNQQS